MPYPGTFFYGLTSHWLDPLVQGLAHRTRRQDTEPINRSPCSFTSVPSERRTHQLASQLPLKQTLA